MKICIQCPNFSELFQEAETQPHLNESLKEELKEKMNNSLYKSMLSSRHRLPAYKQRKVSIGESYEVQDLQRCHWSRKWKTLKETWIFLCINQLHLCFFPHFQEIIDLINSNQIIVLSGETGCGKTTQVGLISYVGIHVHFKRHTFQIELIAIVRFVNLLKMYLLMQLSLFHHLWLCIYSTFMVLFILYM